MTCASDCGDLHRWIHHNPINKEWGSCKKDQCPHAEINVLDAKKHCSVFHSEEVKRVKNAHKNLATDGVSRESSTTPQFTAKANTNAPAVSYVSALVSTPSPIQTVFYNTSAPPVYNSTPSPSYVYTQSPSYVYTPSPSYTFTTPSPSYTYTTFESAPGNNPPCANETVNSITLEKCLDKPVNKSRAPVKGCDHKTYLNHVVVDVNRNEYNSFGCARDRMPNEEGKPKNRWCELHYKSHQISDLNKQNKK